MISRTWIKCLACGSAITARIQVGHELKQQVAFACPQCSTDLHLTLLLDDPPKVGIQWGENCEEGKEEGKVINIGAGFVIPRDKLNEDKYFPSFQAPRPNLKDFIIPEGYGPLWLDTSIATGTVPYSERYWRLLQQVLRFHQTGQAANSEARLNDFFGVDRKPEHTLEFAFYSFFMRFMGQFGERTLGALVACFRQAQTQYQSEYANFISSFSVDRFSERIDGYSGILSEYFSTYGEFGQTLIYARNTIPLPNDPVATSTDFERTKMYYGNAFELLGSHLDFPAALNNVLAGRAYDQMASMTLNKFGVLNKASRTNCFSTNAGLSALVAEFDSTIRNASHHRWFKLDAKRSTISYRSGGNGLLKHMSYAEYLTRCNQITLQIMALASLEILALKYAGFRL